MSGKPTTAAGYRPDAVGRVQEALLLVASRLGDLMEDIVVVGGLVPYLLVGQGELPGDRRHVGTMDLDLGLSLALLEGERYREVSARLRAAGFQPGRTQDGAIRRQTWAVGEGPGAVTIDFLIAPNEQGAPPGRLTQIERDFAAVTIQGLDLAFLGARATTITGRLPNGATLTREVRVCGPGAFTVLKARAYRLRGESKDAYDLFYVLRELGASLVAMEMRALGPARHEVAEAARVLREDFVDGDAGRAQVAEFLHGGRDDAIEGDVLAQVLALLRAIG